MVNPEECEAIRRISSREHLDAHVFGTAVDQIFLLIGTNDIGKEIPQKETLDNVEAVLQAICRTFLDPHQP